MTSTTINGITGFVGVGDQIVYNQGDLIEFIGIDTSNNSIAGETVNVLSTQLGSRYSINTHDGDDLVNISSDATATGNLDGIQGQVLLETEAGYDRLMISDCGAGVADTYTVQNIGGVARTVVRFNGPVGDDVIYNDFDGPTLEEFRLIGSNVGDNIYHINDTTATVSSSVEDGDAVVGGTSNAIFNITGDNLSAANLFQGFDGNDQFNLNIALHIGQTPVPGRHRRRADRGQYHRR